MWSAVCVGFLHRLYGSLTSAHRELTPALVEEELIQACTVAQGKEARLVRIQRKENFHLFVQVGLLGCFTNCTDNTGTHGTR